MDIKELKLKTIFCCMSCDGDIAKEEIDMVKKMVTETSLFDGMDTETLLNTYIAEINKNGAAFLKKYLKEVSTMHLPSDAQLDIIKLAIETIEADRQIKYSEIYFFKKIRKCLSITDDAIIAEFPDKGLYLLPDVNEEESDGEKIKWKSIKFDTTLYKGIGKFGGTRDEPTRD